MQVIKVPGNTSFWKQYPKPSKAGLDLYSDIDDAHWGEGDGFSYNLRLRSFLLDSQGSKKISLSY